MTKRDIEDELRQNFVDSSYDTNTNRAFPDAKDGLKPSMRACLWAMWKNKWTSDKPHVKSAKIDGTVSANYWSHGNVAIYETFARMSQPFSNNNPEVDFHGANGNIILGGDAIAADRYTEARLSKIAEQGMLRGVEKNAVDMQLNFSEDELWPQVLPSVFPRLLVNGSQGIGVGVANYWTQHNLQETSDLIVNYLRTKVLDDSNYFPDLPTGATIVNKDDLPQINKTGKGRVLVESKYSISGSRIRFTEFPFQVYVEPLIEEIKDAIEKDKVHGVQEVFNKSDKTQVLLEVTCTSPAMVKRTLAELMSYTSLRTQLNVNQVAIVNKTPTLLNLQESIDIYIAHNLSCIRREATFDLEQTETRIEILEGLLRAMNEIDNIVRIVKSSKDAADSKSNLEKEGYSPAQAESICGMRLSRLSHLESEKLEKELEEKRVAAKGFRKIAESEDEQKRELIERLAGLAKEFGAPRKTKVVQKTAEKETKVLKALAAPTSCIVALSENMEYLKRSPSGAGAKSNFKAINTETDKIISIYTTLGRYFCVKASNIAECGLAAKGTPARTLFKMEESEKILNISAAGSKETLLLATDAGKVRLFSSSVCESKTQSFTGHSYVPKSVSKIISLLDYDERASLFELRSQTHKLIFDASEVRLAGKTSSGRIGIKLAPQELLVSMVPAAEDGEVSKLGRAGEEIS